MQELSTNATKAKMCNRIKSNFDKALQSNLTLLNQVTDFLKFPKLDDMPEETWEKENSEWLASCLAIEEIPPQLTDKGCLYLLKKLDYLTYTK